MTFNILFSILFFITNSYETSSVAVTYTEQKRYTVEEYIDRYVKTDNPAVLNKIRDTYDKVRTDFVLIQSGQQSTYYSPEYKDITSGNSKTIRNKSGDKHRYTSLAAKNVYSKDLTNGNFKALLHSRSNTYKIDSKVPELKWALESETRMILGYKCQRATIESYKGFDVEAWYSPEIPIANGPMEYGGLPGIILELSFASFKYTAKEISFLDDVDTEAVQISCFEDDEKTHTWQEYVSIYYPK